MTKYEKNPEYIEEEIPEYKVSFEKRNAGHYNSYVKDTHITFFHETPSNEVKKISLIIDGQYTDEDNYCVKFFSLRLNDKVIVQDSEEKLMDFIQSLYGCVDSKGFPLIDKQIVKKLTIIANNIHIYPVTQFNVRPEKLNN